MRRPLLASSVTLAGALVVLLASQRSARADDGPPASPVSLHIDGLAGYTRHSQAGPGLTLGADALARYRIFQAGVLADSTAGAGTDGNGNETAQSFAGMAGLGWYGKHVGLDVLGVFGAHVYDHVAAGLYTSGVNAAAPFAQIRLGANLLEFHPLTLGLWAYAGDDLSRSPKSYSVTSAAPGAPVTSEQVTIGESSWGFAFRIGVDFGI